MQGDLTSLARVKSWLGIEGSKATSDPLLQSLITAASDFVMTEIQRDDLGWHSVTEYYDGSNSQFMLLRQWPVAGAITIQFDGYTINTAAVGNPRQQGYLLDPPPQGGGQQRLTLFGYRFPQGRSNITVTYSAGYLVTAEPQTIPAAPPMTVTTTKPWLDDQGVVFQATGVALVQVDADPATGQYAVADGVYTFAEADAGLVVLIDYSYVPAALEQACRELVGERYRVKDRIGIVTHGVGGKEQTSYSQKDMNAFISSLLRTFKRVTPA